MASLHLCRPRKVDCQPCDTHPNLPRGYVLGSCQAQLLRWRREWPCAQHHHLGWRVCRWGLPCPRRLQSLVSHVNVHSVLRVLIDFAIIACSSPSTISLTIKWHLTWHRKRPLWHSTVYRTKSSTIWTRSLWSSSYVVIQSKLRSMQLNVLITTCHRSPLVRLWLGKGENN